MPNKEKRKALIAYNIIFTAVTLILCALFLYHTVSVYYGGAGNGASEIFSPSVIKERLMKILPAVVLWFAVLLFGLCVGRFEEGKRYGIPVYMLKEKHEKRNGKGNSDELTRLYGRADKLFFASVAVISVLSILPILYTADFSNFPNVDITYEVKRAFLYSLPFLSGMFITAGCYVIFRDKCFKDIVELQKKLPKAEDAPKSFKRKGLLVLNAVRAVLLCVGIALTVLGCFNGSMEEVFIKATKICTECIGLG